MLWLAPVSSQLGTRKVLASQFWFAKTKLSRSEAMYHTSTQPLANLNLLRRPLIRTPLLLKTPPPLLLHHHRRRLHHIALHLNLRRPVRQNDGGSQVRQRVVVAVVVVVGVRQMIPEGVRRQVGLAFGRGGGGWDMGEGPFLVIIIGGSGPSSRLRCLRSSNKDDTSVRMSATNPVMFKQSAKRERLGKRKRKRRRAYTCQDQRKTTCPPHCALGPLQKRQIRMSATMSFTT
jgi:hypothetical protein